MIQVEPCKGCGRPLIRHPVGNLVVRLETDALGAQTAAQALLGGRTLWRITATDVKPARNAELSALGLRGNVEGPHIAQEHVCRGRGAPPERPATIRTPPPCESFSGARTAACNGKSCQGCDPVPFDQGSDQAVQLIQAMLGATVVSVDDA